MRLPIFQIDAFTSVPFHGNPAAVMPLEAWLPDALMQSLAQENNLSETAFLVKEASGWRIRWFTTVNEVDLCGHATLASAWVVLNELEPGLASVDFRSRSGLLSVSREGDDLVLDFPSRPGRPAPDLIEAVTMAIGVRPMEVLVARDVLAILEDETAVRAVVPKYDAMISSPAASSRAMASPRTRSRAVPTAP